MSRVAWFFVELLWLNRWGRLLSAFGACVAILLVLHVVRSAL